MRHSSFIWKKIKYETVLSFLPLVTLASDIAMGEPYKTHTMPRNATPNSDLIYLLLVVGSVTRLASSCSNFFSKILLITKSTVASYAWPSFSKLYKLLSALLKPFPPFFFVVVHGYYQVRDQKNSVQPGKIVK